MSTQKRWTVQGTGSFENLKFESNAAIPEPGAREVRVKFHAASLNYRDLIIATGQYGFPQSDGVVPGSDGAGVIDAVGAEVSLWKKGDKVMTLFNQGHLGGPLTIEIQGTGTGGVVDGTLQEYGVYHEYGLVKMPDNLSFVDASTLPCAALTAWNALYGLSDKALKAGMTVLTQGTGGVAIFAVQLAKAAGARVIATTSSAEKEKVLKKLGADHVINYSSNPDWGAEAKKLTGGIGVDHVVEIGGPTTSTQSLKAIRPEGVISIIGFVGGMGGDKAPSLLQALFTTSTIRGILVGSRPQFEEMNRSVEFNNIKPVVDKVFKLEELKDAYQYQWDRKHVGKVCVQIA